MNRGVAAALGAALLFGAGVPVAKVLLGGIDPWLLGGLLYAGSGIAGPVFLLNGLAHLPASGVSLLLNGEGVLTALLAWFVFRENFDARFALGMAAVVVGDVVLTWSPGATLGSALPATLVIAACLAWAIDNNLTRKLAARDSMWLASVKGLVAGAVNLLVATTAGRAWPPIATLATALTLGAFAYGVSLSLFVVALRHLGAARTGAYFSTAPFVGAAIALLWLGEPLTPMLPVAAALMALGLWLHLTEHHSHEHVHPAAEHDHDHSHDEHHAHIHEPPLPVGVRHGHRHVHEALVHSHAHFPDADHQHGHRTEATPRTD